MNSVEITAHRTEQHQGEQRESNWKSVLVSDLLKAAGMTILLFVFLVTFVVQGFQVYGSCMEPNLHTGERVLGNKFVYRFDSPSRGDVIVFRYPKDPSRIYIKRVIGLPGDNVEIRNGNVLINGQRIREPYVRVAAHGSFPETEIAADRLFVLGDYRDSSDDSRYWGQLPMENIEAKIWLRYWPVEKIERLR